MSQPEKPQPVRSTLSGGGVLTLGNFDGFHRGHQTVIQKVVELASSVDGPSIVLTLFPHPGNVLRKPGTVPLLMPLEERIRRLKGAGVDHVEVIPFTRDLARIDATDFAQQFMIQPFQPSVVVAGPDTRFGRDRHGDAELLRELGTFHGFKVICADALMGDQQKISSSTLRSLVSKGMVEKAADWLGRPFSIKGVVLPGDGRGRTIGVPTANVLIEDYVEPASGVYAVRLEVAEQEYAGVANYGKRPTFIDVDKATTVLEVHLLDVEGIDLYEQEVNVRFIAHLRPEMRFDGGQALVEQIKTDIVQARAILEAP